MFARSPARSRHPHRSPAGATHGFTMVEILVASTILLIMVTAVLGLFINMMKSYHYNASRLTINRDVRTFTNELSDSATYANYFIILPDFVTRTVGTSPAEVLAYVADGESGNCLLLVFKDPDDDTKISRLVGYYHDPVTGGFGPIRKFDSSFSPSVTNTNLWTLMPSITTLHTNPKVTSANMVGLAAGTTTVNKLFYNFFSRSIIVKGQIDYTTQDGLIRKAVSTYNFTISPRG